MRTLWSLVVLLSMSGVLATACESAPAQDAHILDAYRSMPLHFELNQGQTDGAVKFLSRAEGYGLFLTPEEVVLVLSKGPGARDQSVLRLKFLGANPQPKIEGRESLPGKSNYFIGSDPSKWRTGVPHFARVGYAGVYPGIDLVFYGNQRQLEYDFVVAAGADPKAIGLSVVGAERLEVDARGDLVLHVPSGGEVRLLKPRVYQKVEGRKVPIAGRYEVRGKQEVAFQVAAYDDTRALVIDPVLSYSTYLSGSNNDNGAGIAVDTSGNAYVTGSTNSSNFPTTAGAFQTTLLGRDAFVTKFDPSGSALVYSTFLGGIDTDSGYGITVDTSGNAYVTGSTASFNFPTTAGAFQTTFRGQQDAFVTKLNPTGSALVYSTFLGGTLVDYGTGITVDASGNAYVTGTTGSLNFPATAGAFQTTGGGYPYYDAFVTKLNPTGSALVYSTYLGGSHDDQGYGIALDASGNAYVTGSTKSSDFPTTPGTFQTTLGGGTDAFVTKLNPTGSALVYSTYLGGSGGDSGAGIAVDASGNAYLTGNTSSANFPTTPGAFQTTLHGFLGTTAFVTKLSPTGSALAYSTYLGGLSLGGGYDGVTGIAVDASGNADVTGNTSSANFPTTPGAFQTTFGGGSYDAFVTKLNPSGSALVYSTFLGGSADESGAGIAVDASGNAYVTGGTTSSNFPTTVGAFETTWDGTGAGDAFVAKIVFPAQSFTLTVTLAGTGSGTVTSNPAGINCGATCNATFPGNTSVTLTATPAAGSIFAGWSGEGCSGTGTCTVAMTQARTVTATFTPQTLTLTIATNATTFRTGDSVIVSVGVNNPGLATTVDFYFGALLPDGDTVVFFKDLAFNSGVGHLSSPATLGPIVAGVNLTAPFTFNQPSFFTYRWAGTEPPGSYVLFLAATKAGALLDNVIDPGDIVVLAPAVVTFAP